MNRYSHELRRVLLVLFLAAGAAALVAASAGEGHPTPPDGPDFTETPR